MIIVTRKIKPGDEGLIFSSAPKGIYWGLYDRPKVKKKEWFSAFYLKLKDLITKADVWIACDMEDTSFVLGYSIIENNTLFFVYVKEAFRKQGIARLLCEGKFTEVTNVTRVGKKILDAHDLKEKNYAASAID